MYLLCVEGTNHGTFEILSVGPDRALLDDEAKRLNDLAFERAKARRAAQYGSALGVRFYEHFYVEEVPVWPEKAQAYSAELVLREPKYEPQPRQEGARKETP